MGGQGAGASDLLGSENAPPVAIITMDSDGRVVALNQHAERMFGYPPSQAVGVRVSDLIVPARLRAAHEAGLDRYLHTGASRLIGRTCVLPAVRADGTEFTVELIITPVRVGEQTLLMGILRESDADPRIPGELALSEAFFRTLVERSPIALSVVELDGTWRWSSEAGVRLHGPIASGASPAERIPAEDRPRLRQLIEATARDEDGQDPVDLHMRGLDGRLHALTVAAENMLTEPAVHGIGLYATDMTRLSEAEHRGRLESARLGTLIASIGVGILLLDTDLRIALVNTAFTELFGIAAAPDHLVGQPVTALAAGNPFADQEASDTRGHEVLSHGRPVTGEEYALADGRIIERDYVPVELDGATFGHLWVFRDITEQAQIRRSLEERNRSLAELANLKTEFIATASHELRTPLTSILTFAHLLQEPGAGPAEHAKAIGAITRNADRMLHLVDDLILLASLEAGTAPLRLLPVDLAEFVRAAVETWRPVAAHTAVTLDINVEDGPRVRGDSRHLHQLVDTLFANAVATTPRGGRIAVHTRFDEPCWTIRLECSSKGGDHIYTRPGRHDDPSAAHSNALALLLSRAIVARHGGEMSSPSEENGMSYLVRLPLDPPPDADAEPR